MRSLLLLIFVVAMLPGCATEETPQASTANNEPQSANETAQDEAQEESAVTALKVPFDVLGPGGKAPQLSIGKWVSGKPVDAIKAGQVYVVEFWATWCGPCLQAMPHMAKLQKQYGDKVTFVGISAEDAETVEPFLERESPQGKPWSEVLTYRIALDKDGETNDRYMRAAQQGGIPCAFVVGPKGLVEWIGHPMEIDGVLEQVVAGTWDTDRARAIFVAQQKLKSAKNVDEALEICNEALKLIPTDVELQKTKFAMLIQAERYPEANATLKNIAKQNPDDAQIQGTMGWLLATVVPQDRDLDFALKTAQRAVELTEAKDSEHLDTLARIHFERDEIDKAVQFQKLAVKHEDGRFRGLDKTLEKYEAALEDK